MNSKWKTLAQKKLLAVILAVAMVVAAFHGNLFGFSANADVANDTAKVSGVATTVSFDNSKAQWDDVYAYVWNTTEDYDIYEASEIEGDIYTFDINEPYENVLFKNVGDTTTWTLQTVDLKMPTTSKTCYKPETTGSYPQGEWYDPSVVPENNKVTVYYKNTKFSRAYIHYGVNGEWTKTPGVKMSRSDNSSYKWMYTIDLGDATEATVCFNNGNKVWDSKNGSNYKIGVGTYGIKNGQIYTLTGKTPAPATPTPVVNTPTPVPVTPTPTLEPTPTITATPIVVVDKVVYFDNTVANWNEVYAYVWNNTEDFAVYDAAEVANNIYTFKIAKEYSHILFKNLGETDRWDLQTNDLFMPTTGENCYKPEASYSKANGIWYDLADATPEVVTPTPTRTPILPVVKAQQSEITLGESVIFDCSASYENGSNKNSRSLTFTNENGESYSYTGFDEKDEYTEFEKVGTFAYTYKWTPKAAGTYKIKYSVAEFDIRTEYSEEITVKVNEKVEPKRVYFDNTAANWNEAYAYVWNNTEDFAVYSATKVANNIYTFDIDKEYTHILFKNLDGTDRWDLKTADLLMPTTADNCYKPEASYSMANGAWYNLADATPDIETPTPAPRNKAVVYYNNSNFAEAYIHMEVKGVWTNLPGMKMKKSNLPQYTWMYEIDLGDTEKCRVCFNNGNGSWDSDDGKNYQIGVGTYFVFNRKVTKIGSVVTPSEPTVVKFDNSKANWNEVYAYVWNNTEDYAIYSATNVTNNIYTFSIDDEYAYVLFKNLDATDRWDLQTNDLVMPTSKANCYKPEASYSKANGTWYDPTAVTPAPGNTVTLYYNSSWSNTYVHYCVDGGAWTKLPGVKMTKTSEKSGYNYKVVIDLGKVSNATLCFNNGNGSWDSKNGSNYRVSKGVYGVKSQKTYKLN